MTSSPTVVNTLAAYELIFEAYQVLRDINFAGNFFKLNL